MNLDDVLAETFVRPRMKRARPKKKKPQQSNSAKLKDMIAWRKKHGTKK